MGKCLIVVPTYNEKDNIAKLLNRIGKLDLGVDVLVVDDDSPDGTGKIAENFSKKNDWVFTMHRKEKEGLGAAYMAGFKWALEHGYEKIISMDADFSHPVEKLDALIDGCDRKTVAIGSRYVKGGRIEGWAFNRYLNSYCANWAVRSILSIKAKDATAGYKCYPADFLKQVNFNKVISSGYAFQVEMLLLAQDAGFVFKEIPIVFVDRVAGESKISGELFRSISVIFKIALNRRSR